MRRPPRSTRTDTLFPYTTLFRSARSVVSGFVGVVLRSAGSDQSFQSSLAPVCLAQQRLLQTLAVSAAIVHIDLDGFFGRAKRIDQDILVAHAIAVSCDSNDRLQFGAQTNQDIRSEEHTSELQSLMRRSYAVFCLK